VYQQSASTDIAAGIITVSYLPIIIIIISLEQFIT